ncbi:AMINO ACID TRANSPORTER AVT1H [Salix viminalis]|uniref:AMINO ACID TRANSPORTER AVT1H n=1 Tax=Salix viminalis TaxID=40686 RepID=A0A9Q0NS35_SALVM|nr:AMINO ACID TRANSPORTER AVT1H [Salix viminalis]
MWNQIRKSSGKLLFPESADCLSHRNIQVASETVHGEKLAPGWVTCDACVEESKLCKCDHSTQDLKSAVVDDADVENHPDHQANSSFAHSVINMIGMLIGIGVICAYTSHLLGKCLAKSPKSRSYTDIGQHAFGSKGRVLATTFIYLEIFMALVSYTISLHDNLATVFAGTQLRLPAWASLYKSQLLTMMGVLVALPYPVAAGSFFHIFPLVRRHSHVHRHLHLLMLATSFSPDLYKSMKDPSKFTKVSIVSFASVTALYASLAFMGAKLFGPEVSSQITLSMPRHHFITKIALWATVLTPMTKYALEFAPFAIQLEHSLPSSISSRTKTVVRGAVGSFLLLVILALALSVPYFEHVLSLTGSLVSVSICIVFPCIFYIKLSWPHISRPVLTLNVILVAFGFVLGVVGTISSSKAAHHKHGKSPPCLNTSINGRGSTIMISSFPPQASYLPDRFPEIIWSVIAAATHQVIYIADIKGD